jgi:hypothetical protein
MVTRKMNITIWRFVGTLVISALISGFSTQVGAQFNLEKLIGTWKLVSIETFLLPDNKIVYEWMGEKPLGLIMYDQTGYMSVQFMRDPRPTFSSKSGSYFDASPEEIKNAYAGYYAYFGTYEVNESEGSIIHHVKGSLMPAEVGIDYKRFFKFEGKRIILTTPQRKQPGTDQLHYRHLIFERVEKGK